MVTTIQINEGTLELLKKLKLELNARTYDEAIIKASVQRVMQKSMAGSLAKYVGKKLSKKEILEGLRDKHDRF